MNSDSNIMLNTRINISNPLASFVFKALDQRDVLQILYVCVCLFVFSSIFCKCIILLGISSVIVKKHSKTFVKM